HAPAPERRKTIRLERQSRAEAEDARSLDLRDVRRLGVDAGSAPIEARVALKDRVAIEDVEHVRRDRQTRGAVNAEVFRETEVEVREVLVAFRGRAVGDENLLEDRFIGERN